ncbi:hypothetical protein [uncultured Campylobacter sp.]|uniref:hypothetical protein n=1 Tax=uncultured Campylobacter sp. TaxID=218934 RepID=UPI0025FCE29A|nr:hypothetical protein [uncultured Campylobacter sp.]
MKTLRFVLRKVFKFIFLFWVVISSLLGSYVIADNFFGRNYESMMLVRSFGGARVELQNFMIDTDLRVTTIGKRFEHRQGDPLPDFSEDNSTGAPYELNIKFNYINRENAPKIVLKNTKLEQEQSGRVVFERDELEAPIEVSEYSGIASASVKIPSIDSIHVRHKLSTEICVSGGTCTKFVHYFLPYRHVEGTAALRGIF